MITYQDEEITDYSNLRHTFDMALQQLAEATCQRYLTLAIFKPTEAIPLTPICHLWSELNPAEIKQTLQWLIHSALLQSQGEEEFILPDMYHDFMAEKLGEAGKIQAHQTLLAHYRATCGAEGWHTVPNDGYIYRHLVYHLNSLADHDPRADQELHGLFAHDHWLYARLQYDEGQYEGYVADVMTAWQRVQGLAINQPDFIAANVRYALIRTSLNGWSQDYVPELVARMVETGLWSRPRAFAVADPMSNVEAKTRTLTLLSAQSQPPETLTEPEKPLNDELLNQTLPSILALENERHRINALTHLARQMTGEAKQAILSEILRQIWAMESTWGCVQAVAILAGQLEAEVKETVLNRALELAWMIETTWNRTQGLMLLLPHLTSEMKAMVIRELLHFVAVATDEAYRTRVLIVLVPHLAAELVAQVLQTALKIKDTWCRTQVLIALAPYLTGKLLVLATHSPFVIPDETERLMALATLKLPFNETRQIILTQALHATLNIRNEYEEVQAIIIVATQLSGEAKQAALKFALKLTLANLLSVYRSQALAMLIPHLKGELLSQALLAKKKDFANSIRDTLRYDYNRYYDYYINLLTPELAIEIIQQLLATKRIYNYTFLIDLVHYLTPEVKEAVLAQILQAILQASYPSYRVDALIYLATHLEGEAQHLALKEALRAAIEIKYPNFRLTALVTVVLHLEGEAKQLASKEAFHTATEIKHPNSRLTALITIAPHLPGTALSQLQAELRATLIAALLHGQGNSRSHILKLLSIPDLFNPLMIGVPTETMVEAIANHIHEICTEWR